MLCALSEKIRSCNCLTSQLLPSERVLRTNEDKPNTYKCNLITTIALFPTVFCGIWDWYPELKFTFDRRPLPTTLLFSTLSF